MNTQATVEKKSRFQIDKLEDRIAPAAVAVAAAGGIISATANAAVTNTLLTQTATVTATAI